MTRRMGVACRFFPPGAPKAAGLFVAESPMAQRGRKPGFVMSDEHRTKIANSQILKALVEHVEGKREMSASQVSAGLGLLRKVMPDLTAVEMSGEVAVTNDVSEKPLSEQEWAEQQSAFPH